MLPHDSQRTHSALMRSGFQTLVTPPAVKSGPKN